MTDNKEAKWTPETNIMKPYLNLEPQYEIIYKDKPNLKLVKVKLKNNVEFILKQLRIEFTSKSKINHLIREYRMGNILGELTDGIVISKNDKKKEIGEYTIIEILMEYGGIPLSKFVEEGKLEKGDTMNIACQLLSILTLMEELGMSHLDVKLPNIVWDKNKNRVKLIEFGTSLMSLGKDNIALKEVDSNNILEDTEEHSALEIREKAGKVIAQKLDVCSFGVTFLRLLAAEYKIQNPIEYDENSFIKKFNTKELKEKVEKVEKEDMDDLWEIIDRTIERTPQFQPTFRELREVFLRRAKGMTKDDYLLDVINNLNDHPIKVELTNNLELKNIYRSLMHLYSQMENYDMVIKCTKKYLKTCSELEGESSFDVAYSYYKLANLYFAINKEEEVISCLEKALSILLKMPRENNRLLKMVYKTMTIFYTYSGDYKKAKEQYDEASKIEPEEYDTEAELYYNLIETYAYMVSYENAKEECDKLLEEIEKKESIQGKSPSRLYITLGSVYLSKGDYEAAKEVLNEVLNTGLISKYREQDPFLITAYLLLGVSDILMGNYDQAIKAFDEGLNISLVIHGEIHMYSISLCLFKAFAYKGKGDYERCIELCNNYLNISIRKFGSQHRLTLQFYLHLGISYCEIGDSIKAKLYLFKALDIAVKLFKEKNISHVLTYNALGRLFVLYESSPDEGIDYCNRALNILLKIYDKNHPLFLETYSNLVVGYYLKSDFQKVIESCKIGLKILSSTGTKESKIFGLFCFYLGNSYSLTGNRELGISYTTKFINTFSSIYDNESTFTENTYSFLGYKLLIKDDYADTLEKFDEVSKTHENTTIEGNINTFFRYIILGNIYRSKKDYSSTKAACKQALGISLDVFGEFHFITATCLYGLGIAYVGLKNIRKAERCLVKALKIQMRISAETDYLTGLIYSNLAIICKITDRYREALYALKEGLNILDLYPTNNKNWLPILEELMEELRRVTEMSD